MPHEENGPISSVGCLRPPVGAPAVGYEPSPWAESSTTEPRRAPGGSPAFEDVPPRRGRSHGPRSDRPGCSDSRSCRSRPWRRTRPRGSVSRRFPKTETRSCSSPLRVGQGRTEARPASLQSVGPILFHAGGRQNRTSRGRNPPRLPALHASDRRRSGALPRSHARPLMRLTHGERSDCSPDEQRIGPSNPKSSLVGRWLSSRQAQRAEVGAPDCDRRCGPADRESM